MTTAKASTILKRAKRLISDPSKWTKNYAVVPANADKKTFKCACAMGAVWLIDENGTSSRLYRDARCYLRLALPWGWWDWAVHQFNDAPTTTHEDVMALFDRAIELAEKDGR